MVVVVLWWCGGSSSAQFACSGLMYVALPIHMGSDRSQPPDVAGAPSIEQRLPKYMFK